MNNQINSISGFTSQLRFTGLSGLDTESIVQQLMRAERIPLDSLRQQRTLLEWKQQAYRDIITSLKGFQTKFFDIVNRSSYLLSENSIKAMAVKSSNSNVVTATAVASSGAAAGTHTIHIERIATAAKTTSSGGISSSITGLIEDKELNLKGKKIIVNLDGVTKEITLDDYTGKDDLVSKLQASLNSAFGEKLEVSATLVPGDEETPDKYKLSIKTVNGATRATVYESSSAPGGLADLGIENGASNRISLKSTLASIKDKLDVPLKFDGGGFVKFKINGETIVASATDTLEKLFSKINNNEKANAIISYDEISDKITLTAKQTGTGQTLKIEPFDESGGDNFLEAFKLGAVEEGQDAVVYIDGSSQSIVRSTNNFTVNGITYNLIKAHESETDVETITVEQDTETVIKNIKSFIEEYNNLIDLINGKVKESYDRSFLPLTDAQKEAMSEKDIENWEKKAKTGLLRNDSLLQQITSSMRRALYEKIEGVNLSLKDVGIESRSYTDNGKLYLDEDKLKNMLLSRPDEVAKLFCGVSAQNPVYNRDLTKEQRADRYAKSGVLQRLSDILNDNISTIRNKDGKKGILLEKAGIENDMSFTENLINKELDDMDDRIGSLIVKLTRKEENYYKKFSALETYLNRMNQQSAWLLSQFGGGS